jgi:hypothetical protein
MDTYIKCSKMCHSSKGITIQSNSVHCVHTFGISMSMDKNTLHVYGRIENRIYAIH